MKLIKGFSVFVLMLLSFGCDVNDDEVNYHFVTLNIVDAQLPEAFRINETYEVRVTYQVPNGCTSFEGFDIISESYTTRRVVAIGIEVDDRACTQALQEVETSFQFICLYNQPYLFRFFTGMDEDGEPQYLEVEVPVE